jgi:hypothetical protein
MFTSGRNLQLFVPSSETQNLLQDSQRHRHSLLSGVQVLDGSRLSREGSRTASGVTVHTTSTTLLRERSRAELLNIVPDVDGVWVTSEKSEVGLVELAATKADILQFSSILIKAEQTDLDRPYLESVDVERSAVAQAGLLEIAQTTFTENDEMLVDSSLILTTGEQIIPTPNPFTPLHHTWSAERGEVTLPSHDVQEMSPSPIVQIAPFDHNHHANSSLTASNSGIHYRIAVAVALLSFSLLFLASKVRCFTTENVLADILILLRHSQMPSRHYFSSSSI